MRSGTENSSSLLFFSHFPFFHARAPTCSPIRGHMAVTSLHRCPNITILSAMNGSFENKIFSFFFIIFQTTVARRCGNGIFVCLTSLCCYSPTLLSPAVPVFLGISHSGAEWLLEGSGSGNAVAIIQREGRAALL